MVQTASFFQLAASFFLLILARGVVAAQPVESQSEHWDLLVIAPHSDDEAIGCTGVILRAIENKRRVGVVVVTAGDGFPKAAAAVAKKEAGQLVPADFFGLASLRQRHTLQAMKKLGVPAADTLFLGYPDGGLKTIYTAAGDTPYRQPYTEKTETYGVVVGDYHARRHGRAAPYVKQAVVDDLAEIIRTRTPQEIYVTNEIDSHSDHAATFWFVRDAAVAAGFSKPLVTFVVHGRAPLEPPDLWVKLSEQELRQKRATIEIYQSGVSPVHDELAEKYSLPEERFWLVKIAH